MNEAFVATWLKKICFIILLWSESLLTSNPSHSDQKHVYHACIHSQTNSTDQKKKKRMHKFMKFKETTHKPNQNRRKNTIKTLAYIGHAIYSQSDSLEQRITFIMTSYAAKLCSDLIFQNMKTIGHAPPPTAHLLVRPPKDVWSWPLCDDHPPSGWLKN